MVKKLSNTGGIVLRCDQDLVIQQVLFSELEILPARLVGKTFVALAQENAADPILHFVEALRQFGHADGWHLPLELGGQPVYVTFSGTRMNQQFILVGNLLVEEKTGPSGLDNFRAQSGMDSAINLEDHEPFAGEMNKTELLRELNLLNQNNQKQEPGQ